MPWVTDSSTAGYMGPLSAVSNIQPMAGQAWEDFLTGVVAGVTNINQTLVRPRWQQEPLPEPPIGSDWVAAGPVGTWNSDWQPAMIHVPTGNGYDALQRHEVGDVLCSFYGPNSQFNAILLREGLSIGQNRAALSAVGVAIVEKTNFTRVSELFRGAQFRERWDITIVVRREIRFDYPILSLLHAHGTITDNGPGKQSTFTLEDDWVTQ